MKATILISDPNHPVVKIIKKWKKSKKFSTHQIDIVFKKKDISEGDFLFLVSYGSILESQYRDKFKSTLVLHASDLPDGKGWSPYIWEISRGSNYITLSLIEAVDSVDSGPIIEKLKINLNGYELLDEINNVLFKKQCLLMEKVILRPENLVKTEQFGKCKNFYRRRTVDDSKLDINKTLSEQFNLLRVVDNDRFPAHFEVNGHTYVLKISRINKRS